MPFYQIPEKWDTPESGLKYTKKEFDERIAKNVLAMNLEPGSLEDRVMNGIEFLKLDLLFNGTPN